MCGVFGLFGAYPSDFVDRAMAISDAALFHRGPDSGASIRLGRASLLSRRLAIVDRSSAGDQPMHSPDARHWIAYNGMLYNHAALRSALKAHWTFRGGSDTEVVLASLCCWGVEALDRFEGMFALLWWDDLAGKLVAAVDHLGIKPLLYRQDREGRLCCSSELGPIVDLHPDTGIDYDALGTYLATGLLDHSDRTLLGETRQLRRGQILEWTHGGLAVRRARQLRARSLGDALGREVNYERLVERELAASVSRHLDGDVPVGIALSSGVDSNLLCRLVRQIRPDQQMQAITHCYPDSPYDEGVRLLGFSDSHAESVVRVDISPGTVESLLPQLTSRTLEPVGGLGVLASSETYRTAGERGLRVMLTGEGADELFGGYAYYAQSAVAASTEFSEPQVRAPDGTALAGPPLVDGFTFAPIPPELGDDVELQSLPSPLRRAMWADLVALKLPKLLRFQDRMSMFHSVEARAPFLDLPLVRMSFALPDEELVAGGVTKVMLRRLLRTLGGPRVPPKKFHVSSPQREWIKGSLGDWIVGLSRESRLVELGVVDGGRFQRALAEYRDSADLGNSFFAWQFAAMEIWLRAVESRRADARRRPR